MPRFSRKSRRQTQQRETHRQVEGAPRVRRGRALGPYSCRISLPAVLQLNAQRRSRASAEEIGNVKHARLGKQSEGLQTSAAVSTVRKNTHSDTHMHTQPQSPFRVPATCCIPQPISQLLKEPAFNQPVSQGVRQLSSRSSCPLSCTATNRSLCSQSEGVKKKKKAVVCILLVVLGHKHGATPNMTTGRRILDFAPLFSAFR